MPLLMQLWDKVELAYGLNGTSHFVCYILSVIYEN
jgi:hypothetical protein